jgi:hypothetical protein
MIEIALIKDKTNYHKENLDEMENLFKKNFITHANNELENMFKPNLLLKEKSRHSYSRSTQKIKNKSNLGQKRYSIGF